MDVSVINNQTVQLDAFLKGCISGASATRIAVAFISQKGLDLLSPAFHQCLKQGGMVEFLTGLDMQITEPRALQSIFKLSQQNPNVHLYCLQAHPGKIYHPKMYLMHHEDESATVVISSSNLTTGGLRRNIEVNNAIHASQNNPVIQDSIITYNLLKFHQRRIIPDEEFLTLYAEVYRKTKKTRGEKSIYDALNKKASELQRPKAKAADLTGWMKVIYQHIPEGEFINADLYAYQDEFKVLFPGNQNIKAKIRQQLQYLRDIGLIAHLSKARWVKLD